VGVAAFLAYGGGFPNTDAMWTLVWGREVLHLDTPSWSAGATPHTLTNLLGVVAAVVPSASETVLLAVGYLAVGALVDALRPDVPCLPLVVPNNRLEPVTAVWLDVPLSDVRDGRDGIPDGSYLWGTPAAMKDIVVIAGRAGGAAPEPSAPVVRRSGGWTLTARCG